MDLGSECSFHQIKKIIFVALGAMGLWRNGVLEKGSIGNIGTWEKSAVGVMVPNFI